MDIIFFKRDANSVPITAKLVKIQHSVSHATITTLISAIAAYVHRAVPTASTIFAIAIMESFYHQINNATRA